MPLRKNVFLIGMPGAGKSTVGRLLAAALDQPFVDSDEEIVRRNGVEIATIFEIEGEAGFREREAAVIDELTQRDGVVLATGGGAVLRDDNRRVLRTRGLVVYLRASVDILEARTHKLHGGKPAEKARPLLEGEHRRAKLDALLAAREPHYNQTAHIVIDANTTHRAKFLQKLLSLIDESHSRGSAPEPE